MISTTHRFIFIHIPKTGGNSIQRALLPFVDDQLVPNGPFSSEERFNVRGAITSRKHMLLQEYADVLGPSLSEYRTVCTLRDPLDRALSLYYTPVRILQGVVDAHVFDHSKFISMLANMEHSVQFMAVDGQVRRPDIVLWFDNLSDDFRSACRTLGLPEIALQRLNVSGDVSGLRDELKRDPKVIEIVREKLARDYAFIELLRGS